MIDSASKPGLPLVVEKLENELGTKEPSLTVIIRKVAPREQSRPWPDNCPPGIRIEWIDLEKLNISQ